MVRFDVWNVSVVVGEVVEGLILLHTIPSHLALIHSIQSLPVLLGGTSAFQEREVENSEIDDPLP